MRFHFRLASWTISIALIVGMNVSSIASAETPSLHTLPDFPSLAAREKRMVIFEPPSSGEAKTYIKIIIGKTVAENCHFSEFIADLLPRSNWGKISFRLAVTPSLATLVCPESTGSGKFVPIRGQRDSFINLAHSSEPLVIDIPAMLELRYQRWDTCVKNDKPILGTMCPGKEKTRKKRSRMVTTGACYLARDARQFSHALNDFLMPPGTQ